MAWWTPHIPFAILLFAILFMSPLPLCQGQDDDNDLEAGQQRARANPLFARVVYERLMGLTTSFVDVIGDNLNFCVKDS